MSPGDLIADRYRLREPIATGGMGDVWRADDEVLGRSVAIKAMRSEVRADPTFSARFRLEARSMAALQHPGIVSVYDYGEIDDESHGYAYLVMPLVEGESLGARVARDGRLSPAATMNVVAQVARALQAVHDAGIIHRDVKPDNVLIDDAGRAVLVDFGVVRSATATSGDLTGSGQIIGTARYMAPEQVSRLPLTPATDLYALGAVAYHCLSGAPPFVGSTPAAIALCQVYDEPPPLPDEVPRAVRDVVATAMAKDPTQRYDSAAAMAEAAEAAVGLAPTAQGGIAALVSPRRADQTLDMPAIGRNPSSKAARVLALAAVLGIAGIVLALALGGAGHNSDSELTTPTSTPSTHAHNGTGAGKPDKPTPATSTGAGTNPVTQPSATHPSATQPSTTPPSTTRPSSTPTNTSSPSPNGSRSSGTGSSGTGSSGTGSAGTGSSGTGSSGTGSAGTGSSGTGPVGDGSISASAPEPSP